MKTAIFMLLLLAHVPNAHAATKTLNASGQGKLLAWAQKVARIYGTALKNMPSGVKKTEDLDIYIYARSADGLFTTSGYARVNYTNSNMTFTPTCMGAGTSETQDDLHCISALHPTAYKDYGAYNDNSPKEHFGLDPYDPQLPFGNGHGACLGNRFQTFNLSCIKGIRKYVSSKSATNSWSVLAIEDVGTGCKADANLPTSFSPASSISCTTKAVLDNIKSKLDAYKTYLGTCNNGVLPAAMNIDLTELDAVLNDIQNGYLLADGDITQGDTYPPPAKNAWTFVNPTLAPEEDGDIYQEHLPDNEVPNKFKVKVTNAIGGVPIGFTVSGAPSNNWAFLPDNTGQSVTRTANSIAETRFKLGSGTGIYPIKATCAECCPGEVAFTAKALTEIEATRLKEVFCDGTYFAGQTLPYPLRVKAYNKFTNKPRDGMLVIFSKVPTNKGGFSETWTETKDNGIARTNLTLGPLASGVAREQYTISAVCPNCLANTTVTCPVEAIAVPNQINPQTDLELFQEEDGVSIAICSQEGACSNVVAPSVPAGQQSLGDKDAVVTIQTTPNTAFTATIYTVPNSGGHQHPGRPMGTWHGQTTAPNNVYTGTTDPAGKARLTYDAGVAGGEDRIEVETADGKRGRKFIFVRVVGLRAYPRRSANHTYASNTMNIHPNFLYGTQTFIDKLDAVATQFKAENNAIISINDMSLISGGIVDICGDWTHTNTCTIAGKSGVHGHLYHRDGTSVDINARPRNPINGQPAEVPDFLQKLTTIFNQHGCCRVIEPTIHFECPSNGRCN